MKTITAVCGCCLSTLALANTPIQVPGSDTSIGFAGKIHVDLIVNDDDMGNLTGFSPATIPTSGNSGNMQTTMSAGQSKFQFMTATPVDDDSVTTLIEWDWFNTDNSSDFHLTQIWAEYNGLGGGQTFSVFMDISTFPNTLEYWGPNAMVFVRQPQIRYTIDLPDAHSVAFAIEKPSSAIEGVDSCASGNDCKDYTIMPDFTAHWRAESDTGHFQIAGIIRQLGYQYDDDTTETTIGYGINLTGSMQFLSSNTLSAAFTAGEGIGRYINDSSFTDSDAVIQADNKIKALPVWGAFAFIDHQWNDKTSSSIGYGYLEVDTQDEQSDNAFKQSDFFVTNILYQLAKPVQIGTELQWGQFEQKNGDSGDNLRWQSSVIYRF